MRLAAIGARILFMLAIVSAYAQAQPNNTDAGAGTTDEVVASAKADDAEFHLPLDEATAKQVDQLVVQLGSPKYQQRERATGELTKIGAPAFAKLRDAYHQSDDFEVHSRIQTIVADAYIRFHVLQSFGFLGISRGQAAPTHGDDPRIGEGHAGVEVSRVHPDTGAIRAGLQVGDIIIALDGEPLPGPGTEAFPWFSGQIKARGVGSEILLTVLRGPEQLDLRAILGEPPAAMIESGGLGREVRDKYREYRDRFRIWWVKYFRR